MSLGRDVDADAISRPGASICVGFDPAADAVVLRQEPAR